jgi:hypothetical protein
VRSFWYIIYVYICQFKKYWSDMSRGWSFHTVPEGMAIFAEHKAWSAVSKPHEFLLSKSVWIFGNSCYFCIFQRCIFFSIPSGHKEGIQTAVKTSHSGGYSMSRTDCYRLSHKYLMICQALLKTRESLEAHRRKPEQTLSDFLRFPKTSLCTKKSFVLVFYYVLVFASVAWVTAGS